MKFLNGISPDSIIKLSGIAFSQENIRCVVDAFYRKVELDPVLKIPFQTISDWPEHIKRLTHFWWIRFGGTPYLLSASYNPVLKHYFDEVLSSEQAKLRQEISRMIGIGLSVKNEQYKASVEHDES